jgi:tetratricopeptide (TPR) repeat protein
MRSRRFLALSLLGIACAPHPSWQDPLFPSGEEPAAYRDLRDAVYNCRPLPQVESLYGHALEALSMAGLPAREGHYWESRLEHLLARFYSVGGDKKKAAEHGERGLALIEQALMEGSFSDGWRMKGELLGQLCLLKGLRFLLANGTKPEEYAQEALRMDPGNAAAQVLVASRKIYPPSLFGGNPRLGLRLMQKALAMRPDHPEDLFDIYSGLGQACRKLRDFSAARRWFGEALELFPGNAFVRAEYAQLAP